MLRRFFRKPSSKPGGINAGLEKILNEHFDWLNEWNETNSKIPKSKADELAVKIAALFSKHGINNPEVQLLSPVQKNQRDNSEFIYSNNLLFKVSSGERGYVVKLGKSRSSSFQAIKKLSTRDKQPSWLARTYVQARRKAPVSGPFFINPEGNYKFDTGVTEAVQIQELCLPLASKLNKIHEDEVNKNANITNMANLVGNHISAILTEIKEKDVIWTDMKAGNILLRPDKKHPIVISDTKAFRRKDQLFVKKTKNNNIMVDHEDTTEIFISEKSGIKSSPEKSIAEWDKEYSYQLAVILYQIATNKEKYKSTTFDFDTNKYPYFNTEEGKRLRFVIEALGRDNPNLRMKHSEAAQLLKHLNHAKEFERLKDKLAMTRQSTFSFIKELAKKTPQERKVFLNKMILKSLKPR